MATTQIEKSAEIRSEPQRRRDRGDAPAIRKIDSKETPFNINRKTQAPSRLRAHLRALCVSAVQFLLPVFLCTACTKFDYHVDQPANLALHITPDQDAHFKVDPLEYQLIDYDNRLVMEISNPTSDTIELLPTKSTVTDPDGISHPMRGQLITAGSSVRLIFPPEKTAPVDTPPPPTPPSGTFGNPADQPGQLSGPAIGLGGESYNPNQSSDIDDQHQFDWNWEGVGSIKVHFVFKTGDKTSTQDFVFSRTTR